MPPKTTALLALIAMSCATVPAPLSLYTQNLAKRSGPDGVYSPLLPELKAQLALEDSAAACSVDVAQGIEEKNSAACQCTQSSLTTWAENCKNWLASTAPVTAKGQ
jgi:hypothetical protein